MYSMNRAQRVVVEQESFESKSKEQKAWVNIRGKYYRIKGDPRIKDSLGDQYYKWIDLITSYLVSHQAWLISPWQKRSLNELSMKKRNAMLRLVNFEKENGVNANILKISDYRIVNKKTGE